MYGPVNHGWIEVVVGPMYSGKSEELIRRIKRAKIAKQSIAVFKPAIDDRYSKTCVASHDGYKAEAIAIRSSKEVYSNLDESIKVVAFDEIQFFDDEIVDVCIDLADRGMRVICAGLDMDFRGKPFGPTPRLLAVAEFVSKLTAVCVKCSNPANRTQRLINGEPASAEDPIILVGATESYEARCRDCHEVRERSRDE